MRIIHELKLNGDGAGKRRAMGMENRRATLEAEGKSGNANTDWEEVPPEVFGCGSHGGGYHAKYGIMGEV